jgi:hypothetical protein
MFAVGRFQQRWRCPDKGPTPHSSRPQPSYRLPRVCNPKTRRRGQGAAKSALAIDTKSPAIASSPANDRNGSKAVIIRPAEFAVLQPLNHATVHRSGVVRARLFRMLDQRFGGICHPRRNSRRWRICHPRLWLRPVVKTQSKGDKVGEVYDPPFEPLKVTRVDQALGSFCLAWPQPASCFEAARFKSSSASRIEKAAPERNWSNSSQLIGAATGAPSRARAE